MRPTTPITPIHPQLHRLHDTLRTVSSHVEGLQDKVSTAECRAERLQDGEQRLVWLGDQLGVQTARLRTVQHKQDEV